MLLSPLSFFSRLFVNLHLTGAKLIFMFASLNNQETSQVGASIYRYIYRFAQMISSYKRGLHILVWWKGQILFESNVPILFHYPKPGSVLYPSTQFKPHSQSCSGNPSNLISSSVHLSQCLAFSTAILPVHSCWGDTDKPADGSWLLHQWYVFWSLLLGWFGVQWPPCPLIAGWSPLLYGWSPS